MQTDPSLKGAALPAPGTIKLNEQLLPNINLYKSFDSDGSLSINKAEFQKMLREEPGAATILFRNSFELLSSELNAKDAVKGREHMFSLITELTPQERASMILSYSSDFQCKLLGRFAALGNDKLVETLVPMFKQLVEPLKKETERSASVKPYLEAEGRLSQMLGQVDYFRDPETPKTTPAGVSNTREKLAQALLSSGEISKPEFQSLMVVIAKSKTDQGLPSRSLRE